MPFNLQQKSHGIDGILRSFLELWVEVMEDA
jgi:hypothetical protein